MWLLLHNDSNDDIATLKSNFDKKSVWNDYFCCAGIFFRAMKTFTNFEARLEPWMLKIMLAELSFEFVWVCRMQFVSACDRERERKWEREGKGMHINCLDNANMHLCVCVWDRERLTGNIMLRRKVNVEIKWNPLTIIIKNQVPLLSNVMVLLENIFIVIEQRLPSAKIQNNLDIGLWNLCLSVPSPL